MRRSNVRTRWLAQKGCIATIASLPVVSDTSILIASSPVISRFSAWALNVTGTLAVSTPRPSCAGDTWYRAFEGLHAGPSSPGLPHEDDRLRHRPDGIRYDLVTYRDQLSFA